MARICPAGKLSSEKLLSPSTTNTNLNLTKRFQTLNQLVEDAGYRECVMNEGDAKRWDVTLNYIYPSQKNIVYLSDDLKKNRPIHANQIQIAGHDYGIASILPHTQEQAEDFYRCILQEKIGAIINISQSDDFGWFGKFKYWPNPHPKMFGDILVSQLSDPRKFKLSGPSTPSEYQVEISEISIKSPQIERNCTLVRFPDWQDGHGLKTETLAGLVTLIEAMCKDKKPIIHCANGVGRTGTLFTAIALSKTPINTIKNADLVDQYIIDGRLCRNKDFVENEGQYKTLIDFAEYKIKGQFTEITGN